MVRVSGMPRRAAARRCAYHTEQKSLERTFESLDPATIAEVLASHSGNMEAAAMDLVEFERAGLARNARGLSSSDDAEKARDDAPAERNKAVEQLRRAHRDLTSRLHERCSAIVQRETRLRMVAEERARLRALQPEVK